MKHSESIALLASALVKAQKQMEPAMKNATNPHFRSHYADLTSLWEACKIPLAENGLCVIQMPCDVSNPETSLPEAGRITLTTMILHTSGEFISESVSTKLSKDDCQGLGSAISYLRRYCLGAFLGLTSSPDDDGNAASNLPKDIPYPQNKSYKPKTDYIESKAISSIPPGDYASTATVLITDSKLEEGMSEKTGKPFKKWKFKWDLVDGTKLNIVGVTFSSTIAATGTRAMKEKRPVILDWESGQYGNKITEMNIL